MLCVSLNSHSLFSQNVLDQLQDLAENYQISEIELDEAYVYNSYISKHNTIEHDYIQQRHLGIDVLNAVVSVASKNGEIQLVKTRTMPFKPAFHEDNKPAFPAKIALSRAMSEMNIPNEDLRLKESLVTENGVVKQKYIFDKGNTAIEDVSAELVWLPEYETNTLKLSWRVSIYMLDAQNWYDVLLDANSGEFIRMTNNVISCEFGHKVIAGSEHDESEHKAEKTKVNSATAATYNVFDLYIESPSHGSRSIVADPWLRVGDINSLSDEGWHDNNGTTYTHTRGNNVDAYLDDNNSNGPTNGNADRADGGATWDFDFTFDDSLPAIDSRDAAITNLFFWNNTIHDVLYKYGFDEVAGNFQESNFGAGGNGSDSVNAEAQDGGGTNNANFATPTDGGNPRMQMYTWNRSGSELDGDFDNGIIAHEYGHGWSIRLTGGPNTSSCLGNSEQMGEGWSDYLGLMLTTDWASAVGSDRRGIGTYVLGQPNTGQGIRNHPYSTDFAENPFTYDDIKSVSVPHGVGSVWATMLWDMTWAIIDETPVDADIYDGTGGNNIAFQLVMDGLKLQNCSPGFVDGRDAILEADMINNAGQYQCIIWEAFADRGLGFSADQGSSGSRSDGTEAFDLPPDVELVKTTDKTMAAGCEEITFTIEVNTNCDDVNGIEIEDVLSDGLTYVPGSGGTLTGNTVSWPSFDLAAFGNTTVSFKATVDPGLYTPPATIEDTDFESGDGGYVSSQLSGFAGAEWVTTTAESNSPTNSFFADDYNNSRDYVLTSEVFTLSGPSTLSFFHFYDTENGWDGGIVEVSTDGTNWTDIGPYFTMNGYSGTSSAFGIMMFEGNSGGFVQSVADLSAFGAGDIQIRFRMLCDTSVGGNGWYVDDINIESAAGVTNVAVANYNGLSMESNSVAVTILESGPTDLTPSLAILPSIATGPSTMNLVVTVSNLVSEATSGDIRFRIPKDPRYTFSFDSSLTQVGFSMVDNADWTYDDSDANFHIFELLSLPCSGQSLVGIEGTFTPIAEGRTSISVTLEAGSGGEDVLTNNIDAEEIQFFLP